MKRLGLLSFLLASGVHAAPVEFGGPPVESRREVSNKVFGRSSGGIISNVGTVSGSGLSYGGGNLGFLLFLNERLAVGAAYKVETNFSTVPLRGFDLFMRYYYLGPGTVVREVGAQGDTFEIHPSWAPYVNVEYANRQYYIELDRPTSQGETVLTGDTSALNIGLGIDHRLSRRWELTGELNFGLLPFAGSDPRVKVRWMLLTAGVNYVF